MPTWALTLAYWLHMAATVTWIGGLFFQSVVLAPALRPSLEAQAASELLRRLRERFRPIAWLSLAILIATGLTQMAGSPNYEGLITVTNRWSAAILAKHLAVGLMVLAASYQTWILQPRIERALLARKPSSQVEAGRTYARLTALNVGLGILVLALTALARTA